jgi:uncharacterized delta-60 repeat protein
MLDPFRAREKTDSRLAMQLEPLEDRMMLSTVNIFAAGQTGEENLDLFIDGQYVTTFHDVGGDVDSRGFVELTYNTDEVLSPGKIGIAFGNDFYDSQTGEDRNLLVDKIVVDGVTVETEDPTTRSTGIWRDGMTGPGYYETELFNINAIFSFADPGQQGDRVEFDAVGTTGEEVVELVVGDQVVRTFQLTNAGVAQTFSFNSSSDLLLEDIKIQFVNDLFDSAAGIDRNVQVFEYRVIDSETGEVSTAKTTDANVLSSGIFVPGEGITAGFGAGGFLATNGSIQQVISGAGLTAVVDSSFQKNSLSNLEAAVGPSNEVASIDFVGDLILVDDAGIPISSFGDGGRVNLTEVLGDRVGLLDSGRLSYSDVEFFDDGSILVSGSVLPTFSNGTQLNDPFIAKFNVDGSLDESFSQQGIVQGAFLQLFGFNDELKSVVGNDGRIILFGSNGTSGFDSNYVVSRLNADGTLDTTFGNGGNVYISNSATGIGRFTLPVDVEITNDNQVVFGVNYFGASLEALLLGKINEDGSLDSTFGNGGYVTVPLGQTNSTAEFALDSQDRIVIASDPLFPALTRLTANGQIDNGFGENGFVLLEPDDSIGSQGVANDPEFGPPFRLFLGGFAVDSTDNVIVAASAFGTDGSRPLLLQRVFADGRIDQSFGIAGTSVVQSSDGVPGGVNQLLFDSDDRLVVGGTSSLEDGSAGILRIKLV